MIAIHNILSVLPYGEITLYKAEKAIDYSKNQTLIVYNATKGKIKETHEGYLQFRKNINSAITNFAQETADQILWRFENLVGVQSNKKGPETVHQLRNRLQIIFQAIFRQYVLKNRIITNKRVQALIKAGRNISIEYLVPLYISLKATLIVTKQMLIEFMQSKLSDFKLSYESSKDNVVMFVHGNFNEEKIKQRVFEGIDQFKKFTIKVVNRGLEIRVDRQSLMENYDTFAINFLEVVKELREKGQWNIQSMKKRSRELYKQVVNRIRVKQLQMKTELKNKQKKQKLKQQ